MEAEEIKSDESNAVFHVPNTEEGRYFLHLCKKYMNNPYSMRKRGRRPDVKLVQKKYRMDLETAKRTKQGMSACGGVNVDVAQWFAVYLQCEGNHGQNTISAGAYRHYEQRIEEQRQKLKAIREMVNDVW